jgi:hypothetical protein
MNQAEVIQCVKERLEREGYDVSASPDGYGPGVDIYANKNTEKFLIEVVGETPTRSRSGQDINIAIGEIVKRMKERGSKVHYGIAIPESYVKFLRNFEVGGIQVLQLHLFIGVAFGLSYHLDTQRTIELIQKLKAGEAVYLSLMDIDYKPTS